jgi:hypothetical protein
MMETKLALVSFTFVILLAIQYNSPVPVLWECIYAAMFTVSTLQQNMSIYKHTF